MTKVPVDLTDIFTYIGTRQRPLIEGESVFKAGHVILCQLENVEEIKVLALVLQTSALNAPPHEVRLSLLGSVDQWQCVCSCKAGQSGYCKHVIASMIYINKFEIIETLSCTDISQKWGKEKEGLRQLYDSTKISDLCHPEQKSNKRKFDCTPAINQRNFDILVNSNPSSALYKAKQRFERQKVRSILLTSNFTDYDDPSIANQDICKKCRLLCFCITGILSSHCNFTENTSLLYWLGFFCLPFVCFRTYGNENSKDEAYWKIIANMENCDAFLQKHNINFEMPEKVCCANVIKQLSEDNLQAAALNMDQKSKEWCNLRRLRITGSRCYSIYTYHLLDWNNKAKKYFWPKTFYSQYTEHGNKYEKYAISAYKKNNPEVEIHQFGFIICKKLPYIGISPDGVVFTNGSPTKLLEVKCPFLGKQHNKSELITLCPYLEIDENGAVTLKKEHSYYAQVQLGMAILNLTKTDFVVYMSGSGDYFCISVEFNYQFATSLINTVTEKYFKHMLHVYCENKDEMDYTSC